MTRICLINGHPDPSPERFAHALCEAYAEGAEAVGHIVSRVEAGALDLGFLTNQAEFEAPAPQAVAHVQASIAGAEHVVFVYPLWLGTMPAKMKAFLEHVGRGNFFLETGAPGEWPARKMTGKSARVIVTMGMPGFAYRLFFGSHSLKALQGGVLKLSGFKPVRDTVLGLVESGPERRAKMLADVRALGANAK